MDASLVMTIKCMAATLLLLWRMPSTPGLEKRWQRQQQWQRRFQWQMARVRVALHVWLELSQSSAS
jgi:hypothetical protein